MRVPGFRETKTGDEANPGGSGIRSRLDWKREAPGNKKCELVRRRRGGWSDQKHQSQIPV